MRINTLCILLFSCVLALAQTTDERLASQFYNDGEYEKAVELYKKVYRKNSRSNYVYDNYLNALIALGDKDQCENLVNKQIKRNPSSFYYLVDEGYIKLQFKEQERAEKIFNQLIRSASKNRNDVLVLAQSFMRRRLQEYAIQTYEAGANEQGVMEFWPQLTSMYRNTSRYKDLVDLSLRILVEDSYLIDRVFGNLDKALEDGAASEYLQKETLFYIQKNAGSIVFDDLLLRIYMHQKKFNLAFRQSVALDKRLRSEGERVMEFAQACIFMQQYTAAIKGFEYILSLGEGNFNYERAQMGLLNASYLSLSNSFDPDIAQANYLVTLFDTYFKNRKLDFTNAELAKRLSELTIYYTKDVARGVQLLEKIIETPRLDGSFVASCKLLLGDAYLIQNNIWDAKLMYGQVDKQFKEDALGQEAKFRNARLSYFTGDFDWASSQLEILKSATTQLISNNAMELALLIQDNTGLDSTTDAMKAYANAAFLLFQNKIDECQAVLNLIPFTYPNHTLHDEVYFLQAQLEQKKRNFEKAFTLYKKVYEKYSDDIMADNALFQAAEIQLFALNNAEEAKRLYEQLLVDYNSSLFAVEARKKFYALKSGAKKEDLFFEGLIN